MIITAIENSKYNGIHWNGWFLKDVMTKITHIACHIISFSKKIPTGTSLGWSLIDETNRYRRLYEKENTNEAKTTKGMHPMTVKIWKSERYGT